MSLSSAKAALVSAIEALVSADRADSSAAANDLANAIYNFVSAAAVSSIIAPPGTGGGPCSGGLS